MGCVFFLIAKLLINILLQMQDQEQLDSTYIQSST